MRCLCYAKFSSGGSVAPGEFFSHLGAKWTCIEDTAKDSNEAVLHNLTDPVYFTEPPYLLQNVKLWTNLLLPSKRCLVQVFLKLKCLLCRNK
jgi:hypothetical protein